MYLEHPTGYLPLAPKRQRCSTPRHTKASTTSYNDSSNNREANSATAASKQINHAVYNIFP